MLNYYFDSLNILEIAEHLYNFYYTYIANSIDL